METDYSNLITPCFIINKEELQANIDELHTALKSNWSNYIIGYSFKTNSLPWLLSFYKKNNCYAEVVSESEYNLALDLDYTKDKIIYNGPIKYKDLFLEALSEGSIVNLDSKREVRWLEELPKDKKYKVGLRVNYDIEADCPGESTSGVDGGRFGFNLENGSLGVAIEQVGKLEHVQLTGLHMHISSKTRSVNIYKSIAKKACEIKRQYGLTLEYIDVGGGFFGGLPTKPSYDEYVKAIRNELEKEFNPEETLLILEPGASVVGSPIDYICKVTDVKETNLNRFITTDGSRTQIDPLMHKTNYFFNLIGEGENNIDTQVVCGFTCMENDRIITLNNEKELSEGSYIQFNKVGAYTMCLSPLFIEYFPTVYVKEDNRLEVVREKWSPIEYMQKCKR